MKVIPLHGGARVIVAATCYVEPDAIRLTAQETAGRGDLAVVSLSLIEAEAVAAALTAAIETKRRSLRGDVATGALRYPL